MFVIYVLWRFPSFIWYKGKDKSDLCNTKSKKSHYFVNYFWIVNFVDETLIYFLPLVYALSSILICVSDK